MCPVKIGVSTATYAGIYIDWDERGSTLLGFSFEVPSVFEVLRRPLPEDLFSAWVAAEALPLAVVDALVAVAVFVASTGADDFRRVDLRRFGEPAAASSSAAGGAFRFGGMVCLFPIRRCTKYYSYLFMNDFVFRGLHMEHGRLLLLIPM